MPKKKKKLTEENVIQEVSDLVFKKDSFEDEISWIKDATQMNVAIHRLLLKKKSLESQSPLMESAKNLEEILYVEFDKIYSREYEYISYVDEIVKKYASYGELIKDRKLGKNRYKTSVLFRTVYEVSRGRNLKRKRKSTKKYKKISEPIVYDDRRLEIHREQLANLPQRAAFEAYQAVYRCRPFEIRSQFRRFRN